MGLGLMFSEYANEYRELAEQCVPFAAAALHVEPKRLGLNLSAHDEQLERHDAVLRIAAIAVLSSPVSKLLWPRCVVAPVLGTSFVLRPAPRVRLWLSS